MGNKSKIERHRATKRVAETGAKRGPCGVRRYSLRKLRDEYAAIGVDIAHATSDVIAWMLVHVDKRRTGIDRVDGTLQIDGRGGRS